MDLQEPGLTECDQSNLHTLGQMQQPTSAVSDIGFSSFTLSLKDERVNPTGPFTTPTSNHVGHSSSVHVTGKIDNTNILISCN